MSKPARKLRFSLPICLALVGMLELAGLAMAATYSPGERPTAIVAPPASATQSPLRVGVAARAGSGQSDDAAKALLEIELGERLAADLGREIRFVPVDLAQRARALESGRIDLFVGHFNVRPVPAGVNVIVSGRHAGLAVALPVVYADPSLPTVVSHAMATPRGTAEAALRLAAVR